MNRSKAPIDLASEPDFAVGIATVQPALRLFTTNGSPETIEPRVMQVLVSLARQAGQVVSRDELVATCWSGRIVGEDAIQRAIGKLRRLGGASGAFAIETVARVGYRLRAQKEMTEGGVPPAALTNLPRRIGALIGREADLAQISTLLSNAELVTITGPGGVGKTRLAHEAGRRAINSHEDGVWLVEFGPVGDPAQVPSVIARMLGIPLSDSSDATGELLDRLAHWRALFIFDNCEHLLDVVAEFAQSIMRHAPRIKLLVTSQEQLDIEGEYVFRARSLSAADSSQLFLIRARAADPGFAPTAGDEQAIRSICARLDHIPLAIELAAGRVPTFGCENLLTHLDDRFDLLAGGQRTALPRHRTLRAALDWSHSLLHETEATVLRRLSVFVNGFTLEAAAEVAGDETLDRPSVLNALASLAGKSLIAIDSVSGRPRYHLLDTTRAYVLERLAGTGELRTVKCQHASYFSAFFEIASERILSGSMSDEEVGAHYLVEADNVIRALEWAFGPDGDGALAVALVANTAGGFIMSTRFAEYVRWGELALRHFDETMPADLRHKILGVQALAYAMTRRRGALEFVEHNLCLMGDDADKVTALFPALFARVSCLYETGRLEEAQAEIDHMSLVTGDVSSRVACMTDYLASHVECARKGTAAARKAFDAILQRAKSAGMLTIVRFTLIEGTSGAAPYDNADTSIETLRELLAEISPSDGDGAYLMSLCASRLMMHLGLRGRVEDIAEARQLARIVKRARTEFLDFRYALSLACVAVGAGQHQDAARVAGFAAHCLAGLEANAWLTNEIFAALRQTLISFMPEEVMARLWAEGSSITMEEALRTVNLDG